MNVPVPAGGKAHPFTAPETGIYEARCDTHETERASVVVIDHPYVARTDDQASSCSGTCPRARSRSS